MDTAIIVAIIAAVSSSGVMSVVLYLMQRRDKMKEKEEADNSAMSRMILGLGHDKILYLTEKYVRRGAISLKEKRNLEMLVQPYFDLGGNGDCKIGYEECNKLHVVSDDDARDMDIEMKRKEYGYETEQQSI